MAIDQQFFELLRVAIGTQKKLSRPPSSEEWKLIFEMAKKQSLVGVCFAGVQKLAEDDRPQGMLYLTWMGLAAKIQQRNEVMNQRCVELQEMLDTDGFSSVILKGQGVAALYKLHNDDNLSNHSNTSNLSQLRQSGDIDVWMRPKESGNMSHTERAIKVIRYLTSKAECGHTTYHNTSWNVMEGTEVEAHYTPSWMYSPAKNRRLQKWFESVAESEMKGEFSSVEFDKVYVLQHIFRHLFGEGIGLRQVVDYYFVLRTSYDNDNLISIIESLGLLKFAGALMYILESHLGLDEKYLLCPADPEEGAFLLSEIMQAGNFGHYDERISREQRGLFGGFWLHVKRNMHFLKHYPSEVLWCPIWKVWHQLWLRKIKKEI